MVNTHDFIHRNIEYLRDALIICLSWTTSTIISFFSLNITDTVTAENVKEVIQFLNPLIGLMTTVIVFITALIRYKRTKKEKNG